MYKLIKYFGFFLPYFIFVKIFMRFSSERKFKLQNNSGEVIEVDGWRISEGLFLIRPFGKQLELDIAQTEYNIKRYERELRNTGNIVGATMDSYGKEGEDYE